MLLLLGGRGAAVAVYEVLSLQVVVEVHACIGSLAVAGGWGGSMWGSILVCTLHAALHWEH